MHRPPITIYMCGEPLVLQSQSIECIRAVPAWVGIKAIDSRASVGGESEETGKRGEKIWRERSLRRCQCILNCILCQRDSGIGASPEGERFREAAFEMALLCHSGRDTNTVMYCPLVSSTLFFSTFEPAKRIQTSIPQNGIPQTSIPQRGIWICNSKNLLVSTPKAVIGKRTLKNKSIPVFRFQLSYDKMVEKLTGR